MGKVIRLQVSAAMVLLNVKDLALKFLRSKQPIGVLL